MKNQKFVSDFNYDSDGNYELGVSFLATVLKQENIKEKQQGIDIRYKPKTLPRRLEVEQIRLWSLQKNFLQKSTFKDRNLENVSKL
jgi:hypothetical protein